MLHHPRQIGLLFVLALVTACGTAAPGMIQVRSPVTNVGFAGPANGGRALPGIQPSFRVAPGLNLQQAAYNTTVLGQAYQNFLPYALPFAPGYAWGFSPVTNPGPGAGVGGASLVSDAVRQAARRGRGGWAILDDIAGAAGRLRVRLAGSIKDLPGPQHLEAKRLLANIDDALTVLRRRDAGNYVNGTYRARGATLRELVENMHDHKVAPATSGDESAYAALYTALAAFDVSAQPQLAARR